MPLPSRASPKLFGLVIRRERWCLSRRGWFILGLIAATTIYVAIEGIYPFLAITQRADAETLVVEGWIHGYAIEAAAREFRRGFYHQAFTTGGPVAGSGGYINDYQTSASVGADRLIKAGLAPDIVKMVPSRVIGRDRTYSSAIALRDWFREHNLQVRSLNIVTEGAHARRTRLLFEEALGREVKVGVISVPSPDFDASHWWYYSEGLEEIVGEGLGYLYAKFFFYPRESDSAAQAEAVGHRHLSAAPASGD